MSGPESLSDMAENQDDAFVNQLHSLFRPNIPMLSLVTLKLVDKDLLDEIKCIVENSDTTIYFGKSMRDIKCIIRDDSSPREHEIFIQYKSPKKLVIISVTLPYSMLQEKEYATLEEIINAYKNYINSLSSYFYELERLDRFCSIMEPLHPSFKDDYRRILLGL